MNDNHTLWASVIRGKDLKLGDIFYTYVRGKKEWKVFKEVSDEVRLCGFGGASCKGEDTLYFRETDIFINSNLEEND